MNKLKSLEQELLEVITKHTERESADKKTFSVSIDVNENEDVRIEVDWPKDMNHEKTVRVISNMLHGLTSGNWNAPIGKCVLLAASNKQQGAVGTAILGAWSELSHDNQENEVCVRPTQVFRERK